MDGASRRTYKPFDIFGNHCLSWKLKSGEHGHKNCAVSFKLSLDHLRTWVKAYSAMTLWVLSMVGNRYVAG